MPIGEDRFNLAMGKFLARKLRDSACKNTAEDRKNDYFAGYAESYLASLAVRYPEVRKEIEERVLYQEFNSP